MKKDPLPTLASLYLIVLLVRLLYHSLNDEKMSQLLNCEQCKSYDIEEANMPELKNKNMPDCMISLKKTCKRPIHLHHCGGSRYFSLTASDLIVLSGTKMSDFMRKTAIFLCFVV